MSKKDNTVKTDKNQYHHLKKEDRIKIEFMINEKDENGKRLYSNTDIAKKIGVHKSTISRELKRIKSKISVITGKIKTCHTLLIELKMITNSKEAFLKLIIF